MIYESTIEAFQFKPADPSGPLIRFCTIKGICYISFHDQNVYNPYVATPLGTRGLRKNGYVIKDMTEAFWVMEEAQFNRLYKKLIP